MIPAVFPVRSGLSVAAVIEKHGDRYLAFNDDLRVTAPGASQEEALAAFAVAVRDLGSAFGFEDIRPIGYRRLLR